MAEPLTTGKWQRAKEIFEEALGQPLEGRSAFVEQACQGDQQLATEVENLLAGEARVGDSFLNAPTMLSLLAGWPNKEPLLKDHQIAARRFEIFRFIGRGGMGEVYEAKDLDLGERVALKAIRPELSSNPVMLKRFRHELQLARRVTHPNVCRLHHLESFNLESGDSRERGSTITFITMELLEGETLAERLSRQGRMSETEVVPLVCQIAEGLAAAHEAGVIHRDLKPGNIILVGTPGRTRAVITDFGLARVAPGMRLLPEGDSSDSLARSGLLVGTLQYMAPEQLRGGKVTPATDIYALGLIMHEMATGHRPFTEDVSTAGTSPLLPDSPQPPAIPAPDLDRRLQPIVRRCLETDPVSRYGSARDVVGDLTSSLRSDSPGPENGERPGLHAERSGFKARTWAAPGILALTLLFSLAWYIHLRSQSTRHISSIAVLPFSNLSGNSDSEYLADGITEGVIDSLAKVTNLRVVSRNSVFQYKGRNVDPRTIAERLGAGALVTGRLRGHDGALVIEAELVDARKDSQIWGHRYDLGATGLSAVSEEIASGIADEIRPQLSPAEKTKLGESGVGNQAAFDNYLKGRYFWNKRTKSAVLKGIDYFNQAIEADPGCAVAYAGLADSYTVLADFRYAPPQNAFPKARAAAEKALQLNDGLAEAHAALGYVEALHDWNWAAAQKEFREAIRLNPNYAPARLHYAVHLAEMGRLDEALAEVKRAQELDPLSLIINTDLGTILYYAHHDDGAVSQLNSTLEMDPNFLPARFALADAYQHQGRYPEAVENYLEAGNLFGYSPEVLATLRQAFASSGWTGFLHAWLKLLLAQSRTDYVAPYAVAEVYAHLGARDEVFPWLEKAYEERSSEILSIKVDPNFEGLRNDPRFQNLLRRLGLS